MTPLVRISLALISLSMGVFVVPYVFPLVSPILSASSLAGFNNSLAYALYLLLLGPAVYVLARTLPDSAVVPQALGSRSLSLAPTAVVMITIGCHIVLFAALYAYKHGFVFSEALYFQDIIYRMGAGATPFVDFHFFYGPALLYPVTYLTRWFSIEAAYALYYVAVYVAGLYLLYIVLGGFLESRKQMAGWFLFFAIGFFNPYTGLNYTFVRHLLPVVTLLSAWRCFRQVNTARLLVTSMWLVLALTYSPEIGVVTLISVVTLSVVWLACRKGKAGAGTVWAVHASVLVTTLAILVGVFFLMDPTLDALTIYLQPILTFSSGGWNTPIDPSLPVLTMIALTVMVGAAMLRFIQQHGWGESAGWVVAYGVMVILMERAAFGKADVAHIAYSGLPLYLIAVRFVPSIWKGQNGRKWLMGVLLVGIIGPLQFFNAMQFAPFVGKHLIRSDRQSSTQSLAGRHAGKEEIQASIARAVEHFGRDKPYYMHKLEYYRLPIYLQFRLKPFLYYPSLTSAFTQDDIEAVIQELRASGAIVITRKGELFKRSHGPKARADWLQFITSSPLPGSSVFDLTLQFQARLEEPLVDFLVSSYEVKFEDGDIIALVPRKL